MDEHEQPEMAPDLAGYQSLDDLVRGYRASSAEGKRLREQADQLAASNQALTEALTEAVALARATENPRQDVPDRRPIREDELETYGIPSDVLDRFVDRRVSQHLAPIHRGLNARQELLTKHPDYLQFEQAVADYIHSDADLAQRYPKMFAADPVAAMELAFLRYGAARRQAMPQNGADARGRADASIPTSRTGDARRIGTDGDAAVQDAFDRFQKTGSSRDARAFAVARLGPLLEQQFNRAGGQSLGPT